MIYHSKLCRHSLTSEQILEGCTNKITAIKNLRLFTDKGLKECKDEIEAITQDVVTKNYNEQEMLKCFEKYSVLPPQTLTKEEFLQILSDAIDAGSKLYYTDPVEVVLQTCNNIKATGGLAAIAKKIQHFVDQL